MGERMEKFRKKIKRRRINPFILCSFLVLVCILLITIGYSAFQTSVEIGDISATIRVQADIRVTNVSVINRTNGATSNYEDYNVRSITSTVNLPNQNSTITYHVEITNFGNVMQGIYEIDEIYKYINNNTDSNLEVKSKTVNLKEALCDDSVSNKCKLGSITTFDITIGYKNNGYNANNTTHLIELDFDFRRVFDITYNGFVDVSELPNQMIYGDTKTITFTNTSSIPANVIVTGASGSYSSPTLTLTNITIQNIVDSIVITKTYSISYTGFTGNTNGLLSSVTASGGTITFDNTSGIPSSVTVTGATGNYSSPTLSLSNVTANVIVAASYDSGGGNGGTWDNPVEDRTTSVYNPNNVEEGTTIYINVTGAPKVTADANGNITAFEYTNTGSGITINSEMNTGVLAFDGSGFTARLKATFAFGNCTKTICPIISASKKVSSSVNGVLIYEARSTGNGYNQSGTKISSPYNKFRFNRYLNSNATGSDDFNVLSLVNQTTGKGRFAYNAGSGSSSPVTLVIELDCTKSGTNTVFTSKIYDSNGTNVIAVPHANTTITFADSDINSSFDNITVSLGYFEASTSGVSYTHTYTVSEFSIKKK